MNSLSDPPDFNLILHLSTQEIVDCQQNILKCCQADFSEDEKSQKVEEELLTKKLVENLEKTSIALAKEIETGRVSLIDPKAVAQLDEAIEVAMNMPNILDARISQVYLSVFGWNTPLWQALMRMQKLLRTVEVLKETRGMKVAKVEEVEKERRRRRGQK